MTGQTPIEELDLSVRAYNTLKSLDVDFIEDIQELLDRAKHPLARRNPNLARTLAEITARLRDWGDDSGQAGVAARL
jgi:DNA-directed RNA polymerase alpha subunit